jgi:serine/threonine protein kinase
MNKIDREIAILRRVHHPNIVKLCDVIYTDRHIGIILEYASGGELFDYILSHRYLKDHVACKLFAQLISGVSYLHEKGIVHRDLKLVVPLRWLIAGKPPFGSESEYHHYGFWVCKYV